MNTGTDQIKYKILKALKKYDAHLKGIKHGSFADELSESIYELIGGDMNLEWNGVHGFPMELESFARKLERIFGFPMMRDEIAIDAYRWIIEQEKEGKTVKKFYEWARDPERVKYIGKYKNPGQIKNDYVLAFEKQGNNPQNLEVSF